jgi:hypothetical protein
MLAVQNAQDLNLDLAQVMAVANAGMAFGSGFTTSMQDSSYNIEAVTAAQWTALAAAGLDTVGINAGTSHFTIGLAAA